MKIKTAIIIDGKREVHATNANGSYATFCGLDGGVDGEDSGQSTDLVLTDEKITCPDCKALWHHSRRYQLSDFARTGPSR